jgi:hypothetical protein
MSHKKIIMLQKLNTLCFLKYISTLDFNFIEEIYIDREKIFLYVEREQRKKEGERVPLAPVCRLFVDRKN